MTDFKREIVFRPAFDKRSDDPAKNYGIHGVELAFYLIGDDGAVQFVVYTNWQLPHITEEHSKLFDDHILCRPMPADLGYHSPKPMYEGQEPIGSKRFYWRDPTKEERKFRFAPVPDSEPTGTFTPCDLLGGKPCYYDGSGLNAEPVFEILLKEGSPGVWKELERYYADTFKKGE